MAIIDPDGLFHGERLAACSDRAKLMWPWLFTAANGYARLELSHRAIVAEVFRNFSEPPTENELWDVMEEFANNFLVILYESHGVWWAQFDTSQKWLPKYKTKRDEESPAPPLEATERHRAGYLEWRRAKSLPNQRFRKFSEGFENPPKISHGIGIGIGGGVGGGRGIKPPANDEHSPQPRKRSAEAKPSDARHSACKEAIFAYYRSQNDGADPNWDGREGKALARFLAANPKISVDGVQRLLSQRALSEVNHADGRPYGWEFSPAFETGLLTDSGNPSRQGAPMEAQKVTTISPYCSNASPKMPQLKMALAQMATFRQAVLDASTLKLYSARLASERFDDVIAALEHLQEQPRQEGETALPEIGAILALVGVMAVRRVNREGAAKDLEFIAWKCSSCKIVTTGFYPRLAKKASETRYCQRASQKAGARSGEICGGNLQVVHRDAA